MALNIIELLKKKVNNLHVSWYKYAVGWTTEEERTQTEMAPDDRWAVSAPGCNSPR